MSLSPAPLSLLIKAAPILTEDMYGDILPAAWELLLSVDEHMAAAAGLFIQDPASNITTVQIIIIVLKILAQG